MLLLQDFMNLMSSTEPKFASLVNSECIECIALEYSTDIKGTSRGAESLQSHQYDSCYKKCVMFPIIEGDKEGY